MEEEAQNQTQMEQVNQNLEAEWQEILSRRLRSNPTSNPTNGAICFNRRERRFRKPSGRKPESSEKGRAQETEPDGEDQMAL